MVEICKGQTFLQSLFEANDKTVYTRMCYAEKNKTAMTKLIDCLFDLRADLTIGQQHLTTAQKCRSHQIKIEDIMPRIVQHLKHKIEMQKINRDLLTLRAQIISDAEKTACLKVAIVASQ